MSQNTYAGAFESQGLSGVSLACGRDALGIRLACPHPVLGLFDGHDILYTLDGDMAAAPDQSYVRYTWQVPVSPEAIRRYATQPREGVNAPVVCPFRKGEAVRIMLEWQWDGAQVIGRYSASGPIESALLVNGCFAPATVLEAIERRCALAQGERVLHLALDGALRAPHVVSDRRAAEQALAGLTVEPGSALAAYPVALGPRAPLYFTASLASRGAPEPDSPSVPSHTARRLTEARAAHERRRMRSRGAWRGDAEAVAALGGYARTYDPERARIQTAVNRTWSGPNRPGVVFGWDNFFMSYVAAWEDPALGAASLEHIVSVYGEHGIAGGPLQRNLIIPVVYCRTLDVVGELALARRTWPVMMAFMKFWFSDRGDGRPRRDGNGDGLIESGSDDDPRRTEPGRMISHAMDETGYDDLPSYSGGFTNGRRGLLAPGVDFDAASGTLTLAQVGQNSLYCASCRAMSRWARRLGENTDAAWLLEEESRVAGRIRDRLYCRRLGFFQDRYWSGGFSPVKTMTVFFPLLAGIGDDAVRRRLRRLLLDPRLFWGDNVIPTVSRDDSAYCDGLDRRGNYWRGNCWPPTTYMVYLAIKEAGWDEIAAEYARRTHAQFMRYWRRYAHAYENYPPEGDVDHRFPYVGGWGGREIRYGWAALMPLCGLEEVFAPEAVRPGVRFGNPFLPAPASWSGFLFAGARIEAEAGPARTRVRRGDLWEFRAVPGVVVREFHFEGGNVRCIIRAPKAARLSFHQRERLLAPTVIRNGAPCPARWQDRTVTFSLPEGESAVAIEGPIEPRAGTEFDRFA